ncbi:MAG: hypothetical protein HY981_03935 [Candidatus Magasanikbacteria bacterium]|nr:hypothetical protein [Candidatus Magasanikbacteria bacterium]
MKYLTKKNILITGTSGTFFVLLLMMLGTDTCYENNICQTIRHNLDYEWLGFTVIFLLILFFSLLAYRMRDEVFEHWMRFAVWAVPAVIIAHILMYIVFYRNGSPDVFEKIVVVPIFILIYASFSLISLWRIITKWRELKNGDKGLLNS